MVAIAAICIGYLAVRLWGLTDSCLWFDEIFSVHAAELSWDSLLWFVSLDLIHPPLFYVLLKLWIEIAGESVFWLRLFPVVFSVIAIFPFISLCRELKLGKWTHVVALFLLAINGSLIKYAQEVRMYSLLMCLSLFSLWLFARHFVKGKSFLPLVIVNVLMVYTHYFGWFVVLSEVVLIVWFQRIKWRRIVVMFGITFACFLPWAIAILMAARSGSGLQQNIGWMSAPGVRQVVTFILNIIEPFYFQTSSAQPISIFMVTVPLLLIIVAASGLFLVDWQKASENDQRNICFLLIFIKLPILIAFVASWLLPYSIWGTRHLMIVAAPLCIFMAFAVTSFRSKYLRAGAIAFLVVLSGFALVNEINRERQPNSWCVWDTFAREWILIPHFSLEPRRVIATEDLIAYHVWFATREFPKLDIKVLSGLPGVREDKAYFLPRGFSGVERWVLEDLREVSEFWIAFRDSDPQHDSPGVASITEHPKIIRELGYLGFEPDQQRKERIGKETVFFTKMVRKVSPVE